MNHKPRTRAQKRLARQYRILDAIENAIPNDSGEGCSNKYEE